MLVTIGLLILLSIVQIQQILVGSVAQRARIVTEANADLIGNRLRDGKLSDVDEIISASVRQRVVDSVSVFDRQGHTLLVRGMAQDVVNQEREQTLAQQTLVMNQIALEQQ